MTAPLTTVVSENLISKIVDDDGGSIDNTPIGATTPSTGAFTALSGSVTAAGSTTARTLANRFSDICNVLDYGAVADGQKAVLLVTMAVGSNNVTVSLPSAWAASTNYTTGQMATNGNCAYVCTVAGRSGSTGPLRGTAQNPAVLDGTVGWVYLGPAATSANVFSSTDVGKIIAIMRGDYPGATVPWWNTYTAPVTITQYISPTQVVVSQPCSAVATLGQYGGDVGAWPFVSTPSVIVWGTDNSTAIQNALNRSGDVFIPASSFSYCVGRSMILQSNTRFYGVPGASVILPTGVINPSGSPIVAPVLLNPGAANSTLFNTSFSNLDAALAQSGSENITVEGLCFDMCITGSYVGGVTSRFFLHRNVVFKNNQVLGSMTAVVEAPNFTACDGVTVEGNTYTSTYYSFEPWAGIRNITFTNNTILLSPVSMPAGENIDGLNAVQINVVGNASQQLEGHSFSITGNKIYIPANSPLYGGNAISIFPDGVGSIYRNYIISDNILVYTGISSVNYNAILVVGGGTNGIISDNLIDGFPGTMPAIMVEPEPSSASGSTITTVSCTTGSTSYTLAWTGHGYDAKYLSSGPVWCSFTGGPTVGGNYFNGNFRIFSVPDANTIVVTGPAATSTQTNVAWSSGFAQILEIAVGVTISGNRIVNTQGAAGQGLISVQCVNPTIRDNNVLFPNNTTPAYTSLVSVSGISNEDPGLVSGNTGPSGTGAIPTYWSGDNRVMWFGPTPVVIDTNIAGGAISVHNAVLSVGGKSVVTKATVGGTPVVITPTGSTFTYVASAAGFVIIQGGSVSTVVYVRSSSYNAGATSGVFPVMAGDWLQVTYSVAPNMTFFPMTS